MPGAGAGQHRAQAVALHLDRDRLVLVGQQQDFRGERKHPCHLADDADVVDHRLAGAMPCWLPLSMITRREKGSRAA
jgi:hypothetical protein